MFYGPYHLPKINSYPDIISNFAEVLDSNYLKYS